MTPAELHAIYSPLHEKVPETTPRKGYLRMAFIGESWWWAVDHPQSTGRLADIPPTEAAALLRCAVEDWLRSRAVEGVLVLHHPMWSGGEAVVELNAFGWDVEKYGRNKKGDFYGPTIHHALVAACLAATREALP